MDSEELRAEVAMRRVVLRPRDYALWLNFSYRVEQEQQDDEERAVAANAVVVTKLLHSCFGPLAVQI